MVSLKSDFEKKTKAIILSQRRAEDQAFKKYDLLNRFFQKGYVVYTFLHEGEHYTIYYPGEWMFDPSEITFWKGEMSWELEYTFNSVIENSKNVDNIIFENSTNQTPIDMNKYGVVHDISTMEIGEIRV